MSIVTKSASPGTTNKGLNSRPNRVFVNAPGPGPSAAFWWNAAFEPVLQKVLLVVHGTVLVPPACDPVHPAGTVPGTTPSKFSLRRVVVLGVPVNRVWSSVVCPCSPQPTVKTSSMGVPGANVGRIASTKSFVLTSVSPGRIFSYSRLAFSTETPGVDVDSTAFTSSTLCALSGVVT